MFLASKSVTVPESVLIYSIAFCIHCPFSDNIPHGALRGGEQELNVDELGSEIKCVFKVQKDICGHYAKMFKFGLQGPHFHTNGPYITVVSLL